VYPNAIGNKICYLRRFLDDRRIEGALGGVHILPFYPSSADRGFAPLTHEKVDEQFGTWEDIDAIAEDFDLCVDYMVNHTSAESEEFRDFEAKGAEVWAHRCVRWVFKHMEFIHLAS
jgi:glucosylglycerol phosphorylase (configuration-retaining)